MLLADKVDYELTRTDADRAPLKGFERSALDQVFADGSPVMQSDIGKNARAHQSESLGRWNDFKADAATSLRSRKYINGHRSKPFLLNILAAIVVGLAGFGAVSLRLWVIGGIAIAWAAVQIALTPLLRQRSPDGQVRFLQWRGVRNYLRDFSQLADAPVGHLVLWERYLVYAAALGVSERARRRVSPCTCPPEERRDVRALVRRARPGEHRVVRLDRELRVRARRLHRVVHPAVEQLGWRRRLLRRRGRRRRRRRDRRGLGTSADAVSIAASSAGASSATDVRDRRAAASMP